MTRRPWSAARHALELRTASMLDDVAALVEVESPSTHPDATRRCLDVLAEIVTRCLGERPTICEVDGVSRMRLQFGQQPRVLLLGHADTVWPLGTLRSWPFEVRGDQATGPGIFDMKAGLIQAVHGLSLLEDLDGLVLLVTADEEIGSSTSRAEIERLAASVGATLVLEPAAGGGALKVARKGVSTYRIDVQGRAAHAGLEPEAGVNAVVELARVIDHLVDIERAHPGSSVTPTVFHGGTATNVVPAQAGLDVDVRVVDERQQRDVDECIRSLRCSDRRAHLRVLGGANRPPLPVTSSKALMGTAQLLAAVLGIGRLPAAEVGGASDGNYAAAAGSPTLDGLGAVGGGAHARDEHVSIPAMAERGALLSSLVQHLLACAPEGEAS